jgi:hypothetical protein
LKDWLKFQSFPLKKRKYQEIPKLTLAKENSPKYSLHCTKVWYQTIDKKMYTWFMKFIKKYIIEFPNKNMA